MDGRDRLNRLRKVALALPFARNCTQGLIGAVGGKRILLQLRAFRWFEEQWCAGCRNADSWTLRALYRDVFETRLYEDTLPFSFWLISPLGWEPMPWLVWFDHGLG